MIIDRLSKAALFSTIQKVQPKLVIDSPSLVEVDDNQMMLVDGANKKAFIRVNKIILTNTSVIDLTDIDTIKIGDSNMVKNLKEQTQYKNGALISFVSFLNETDLLNTQVFNYVMGMIGITNLLQSECDLYLIDNILTIDIANSPIYVGKLNVKIK